MRETGIQYVLTTTNTSLTINPTTLGSAGYYAKVVEVEASLRTAMVDRPQQHGSYIDPGYEGGLSMRLECLMLHSGASSRQTLSDNAVKTFRDLVAGGGTLTWTPQDGTAARYLTGLTLAAPVAIKFEAGTVKSWGVLLKCAKPYSETESATNVDSSSLSSAGSGFTIPMTIPWTLQGSGGGTLTYANSGSVPIRPKFQMYGPATAPSLVNVTTGERLTFTGSIALGDYWEVDLFERTVTVNGSATQNAPLRTIVPASSTWFECGLGNTSMQMTCSGYDTTNTKLRALQRSAWA